MKKFLNGVAMAAILVAALPAWSQTSPSQSMQQTAPAGDGNSKPGLPGLPGSKSGPTVTPSGATATPSGTTAPGTRTHPSGDQSGVKGLPGNKSGPTAKPPGAGR